MKDKLCDSLNVIEDATEQLWQGKGTDVGEISDTLNNVINIIMNIAEKLPDEDRIVTMSYIERGLSDYKMACEKRDDFLLADCLFYQWREIILIFSEAIEVQ